MEKNKKTKSFHHGNLQQAIIDEALETIKETNGFNFSLREIAQKIGVSHAAAYRHFTSKNDLLIKIAFQGFQKFAEYLGDYARVAAEKGEDPKGIINALGHAYVDFALNNEGLYRTIFSPAILCPDGPHELNDVSLKSWTPLVSLIERGQAEGLFVEADAHKLSIMIWSSLHGYVMLILDRQVNAGREKISPLNLECDEFLALFERSIFK